MTIQQVILFLSGAISMVLLFNSLLRIFKEAFRWLDFGLELLTFVGLLGRFFLLLPEISQPRILLHPVVQTVVMVLYGIGAMYTAYTYHSISFMEGEVLIDHLWWVRFIKGCIIALIITRAITLVLDLL